MKSPLLLALAILAPLSWAAEESPKLPPTAQAILDKAERAISDNRAKYDDANKKPLADAEKALKAEQDKLGKAGKLEEALAIKKILESFRDELVAKVDEKAKEKTGDLLGEQLTSIVGKWWDKAGARKFSFNKDKSVSIVLDTGAVFGNGTWVMDGDKAVITWEKWGKEVVSFSGKARQITSDTHGWVGVFSD